MVEEALSNEILPVLFQELPMASLQKHMFSSFVPFPQIVCLGHPNTRNWSSEV